MTTGIPGGAFLRLLPFVTIGGFTDQEFEFEATAASSHY